MATASCRIEATLKVRNDMVPSIKFVPILMIIAIPMTIKNMTGSNHEVVVRHKIIAIITTPRAMAMLISRISVSFKDLFCTAEPMK